MKYNKKVEMPGYTSYSRNRKDKSHGGIATCVLDSEKKYCLKIGEGKESNEYIITRHNQFKIPINIVNVYGEIENRTPSTTILQHWHSIIEEIINSKF